MYTCNPSTQEAKAGEIMSLISGGVTWWDIILKSFSYFNESQVSFLVIFLVFKDMCTCPKNAKLLNLYFLQK